MSIFYLCPVKGDIPVHLLTTIVSKRLEYLKEVTDYKPIAYNEYVVEGGVYDVVGHYTLCVIAILKESTEFIHFVMKAEAMLFKIRLRTMSAYDLRCFAKRVLRIIRKLNTECSFLESLQIVCQHLVLRDMAHHICAICHDTCIVHGFNIKFQACLPFIAKRQVELSNGVAYVPCCKWKSYLVHLFNTNLKNRLYKTNLGGLRNDPRVMELCGKVTQESSLLNDNFNGTVLKSEEVDSSSKHFPPCMLNLHQHLRKKHRLKHYDRFYYSLFLKDLGMPVEEAVIFWRNEFQQAPNGKSTCCHSWERDKKKFMYGIRHMYGLEGSKKGYMCRNCQEIQNSSHNSEAGCPFKSFDKDNLLDILNIQSSDPLMSQIRNLQDKQQYTLACISYLQGASKKPCYMNYNSVRLNFTPVKYYSLVTKS